MINEIYSSAFVAETLSQDYTYFAGFLCIALTVGLVLVVKRRKSRERAEANAAATVEESTGILGLNQRKERGQ